MNVVSLLPRALHERIERLLADRFTGSVEIHIQDGNIKAFKVVETVRLDGGAPVAAP